MNDLRDIILRQIALTGPMPLSDYMSLCLSHPTHGYYMTRDPLGTTGDFTTSPEISQMFGELIGLSLAQSWMDQGCPAPFALVELGPGRGTLMADILRTTAGVPGFKQAVTLHLVETSPTLRAAQADALASTQITPHWHDDVSTLPMMPLFLVANEFFDALPIRQFVRHGDTWRERVIGVDQDALALGLTDTAALDVLAHRLDDTQDGHLVELCPAIPMIVDQIDARISTHGGVALFIDYGDWRSRGDTFQALQGHAYVDPLADPGAADLTAHVDFEALAQASPTTAHTQLTPQGVFLERLGISQRAQSLAKRLSSAALDSHVQAHRRLTHPDQMGHLFKVLGLFPKGGKPPPGLET